MKQYHLQEYVDYVEQAPAVEHILTILISFDLVSVHILTILVSFDLVSVHSFLSVTV